MLRKVLISYSFQEKLTCYTSPETTIVTIQQLSTTIGEMHLPRHSPMLRYHKEYIHHVHCSLPHSALGKYLGDNSEKGSSKK